MAKYEPEHLEMASRVFTGINREIDPVLCECFAEVLARESAGHSALLQENLELKQKIQALCNLSPVTERPKTLTIEQELAKL